MEDNYQRGDLSGIVTDMGDDMVNVRFLDRSDHAGKSLRCRMVIRADGSLGIDPSGLPVRHPPEQAALPIPSIDVEEVIEDAEVVSLPAPSHLQLAEGEVLPAEGTRLEIQVGIDRTVIYVGKVIRADKKSVIVKFDAGFGEATGWNWILQERPRIQCVELAFSSKDDSHHYHD